MASDVWENQQRMQEPKELPDYKSNREYQSTVFTSYFGEPANAAQLYESMLLLENGEGEGEDGPHDPSPAQPREKAGLEPVTPEDIVFETLEGVWYLARKNDLAFTVKKRVLVIGEHQSTVNQNMPLRSAIYYGRTMEKLVDPRAMYRSNRIGIPVPEFFVFYTGNTPQPLEQTLYLSDSYLEKTTDPMLELRVKVININLPESHPLLALCRPLYEYSWFLWKVREYLKEGKNRDQAIEEAMKDCINQGIMTDFIRKHGSEVRNMLFGEFNLEDAREVWEEEAREEGRTEGYAEGHREGHAEGHREGCAEGRDQVLIQLVSKKLRKGKSVDTIAEELETEEEKIRDICQAAKPFAPDYDPEAIFTAMQTQTGCGR